MTDVLELLNEWWGHDFVRRALVATTVLSFSVAPIGCFMVLRRLSLAGEALAHAIVPGIAVAFLMSGSLTAISMLIGGVFAGLVVALSATVMARLSIIREEASLASLYLIALAIGIFLLSVNGSAVPLKSFLFGKVLGMSDGTLILTVSVATLTLVSFALMLRPLMVSTLDPGFFESQVSRAWIIHIWFMLLVVLNLIAAFRALGTLMAVGLMILPATSARYWVGNMTGYILLSMLFAIASCWIGIGLSLLFSDVPTGPSIILVAGMIFGFSLVFGPHGFRGSVQQN